MKLKTLVLIMILLSTVNIATLLSTNLLSLVKSGYVQGESTSWNTDIIENTTWNLANSPYILIEDIRVFSTAVLTIEAGVVVKFADGKGLDISGGLEAQGNITHRLTFTSNATTPTPGIWDSIIFDGTVYPFLMDYVLIEYATIGVRFLTEANISNSEISNCTIGIKGKLVYADSLTITENLEDGIQALSSPPIEMHIYNSTIINNGWNGVASIDESTIDVDACQISNNTETGVFLSNGGLIRNSNITGNGKNGTCTFGSTTANNTTISTNIGNGMWAASTMTISGCTVTGNGANGVESHHLNGTTTIEDSLITANNGDGIWTASTMLIKTCEITENAGNGTSGHRATEGFSFSLSNCSVVNNSQNGVTCPTNFTVGQIAMSVTQSVITNNNKSGLSGCGYVLNSTVSNNKLGGIVGNFTIEDYTLIALNQGGGFNGTGTIVRTNIYGNEPHDVTAQAFPYNVTAKNNWWGTTNGTEIRRQIWDHENDTSLGYVFYNPWADGPIEPEDNTAPEIGPISLEGTSPRLYDVDPHGDIRTNEPVNVSVYVVDNSDPLPSGVDRVLLIYRVDNGEWWNTTMTRNGTSNIWVATIPGLPGNNTVDLFIIACDKNDNQNQTGIESFDIKALPLGDVTGDGYVGIDDIVKAAEHFGEGS